MRRLRKIATVTIRKNKETGSLLTGLERKGKKMHAWSKDRLGVRSFEVSTVQVLI